MTGGNRAPTWKERENNKRRERRRRAISAKIFHGLRTYGNYKLPKHCDNNEVLKALCHEAGWTVHPDGTTYRKGSKPMEGMNISRSISASQSSSYQTSSWVSFNSSPMSSSFASPASSSYTTNGNNPESSCLIPWLKHLSSASSSSASSSKHIHGGSISAPVTPPMSSPTARTPRITSNWGPHYPFFPSSTPPSPGRQTVPGPGWFMGIQVPTSPTFSLMSSQAMMGSGSSSSRVLTPLQSGTCSPAVPAGSDQYTADVPMAEAMISDEFAFKSSSISSSKGLIKAWEGERIHEGSDDLELTLGCSRTSDRQSSKFC